MESAVALVGLAFAFVLMQVLGSENGEANLRKEGKSEEQPTYPTDGLGEREVSGFVIPWSFGDYELFSFLPIFFERSIDKEMIDC